MIIKGGSRANGGFFGQYLDEAQGIENGNEAATLKEMRGVSASTPRGFFQEIGAIASGTRCENFFYHATMNPEHDEHLTDAQWRVAVDRLEQNLGLEGQPRFVVQHDKDGRTHRHIIWSRIDLETMTARPDGHNFQKHELTARELEIEFGLKRQPNSWDQEGPRPDRGPEYWEQQRAKKTGIDIKVMKAELTGLWRQSDSGQAFKAAIEEQGYRLALGDRRDFVVVDHAGKIHSLPKRLEGVKTADVRAHMADIDQRSLPTATQAAAAQQARFTKDQKFDPAAAAEAWHNRPGAQPQAKPAPGPVPDPKAQDESQQAKPQPDQERPKQPRSEAGPKPGAKAAPETERPSQRPKGGVAGVIYDSGRECMSPAEFIKVLQESGYMLTRATKDDLPIQDAEKLKFEAKGWEAPRRWFEGSLIVVDRFGGLTPAAPHLPFLGKHTVDGVAGAPHVLAGLKDIPLPSVGDGQRIMQHAGLREFQAKRLDAKPLTFAESVIHQATNSRAIHRTFGEQLDRYGFTIARASIEDVATFKAEHDARMEKLPEGKRWKAPAIEVGELMVVTRRGHVSRLNWAKLDVPGIGDKLAAEGRKIESVGTVRTRRQQETAQRQETRRAHWQKREHDRDAKQNQYGAKQSKAGARQAGRTSEKMAGMAASAAGKMAEAVADILSFGATATPQAKKTEDQYRREEIAAQQDELAAILADIQAGDMPEQSVRSGFKGATDQDLANAAGGNPEAAAELLRREEEAAQQRMRNGVR